MLEEFLAFSRRHPIFFVALILVVSLSTVLYIRLPTVRKPEPSESCITFTDNTLEVGLDWRNYSGHSEKHNILETLGGGAAWFDADGDGSLDLYLITGSPGDSRHTDEEPQNALYLNVGNGRFMDATSSSEAGDSGCQWPRISAEHVPRVLDSHLRPPGSKLAGLIITY